MKIDFNKRYRKSTANRHSAVLGVALIPVEWPKEWVPWFTTQMDEHGDEVEIETGEGEWEEQVDGDRIYVCMVGDNHKFLMDVDDLEELEPGSYCRDCGQIGCGHNVEEPS